MHIGQEIQCLLYAGFKNYNYDNEDVMTLMTHKPNFLLVQSDDLAFWPLAAPRLVAVVLCVGGPGFVTVFALVLFLLMFGLHVHTKVILVLAHLCAMGTGEFFHNLLSGFFGLGPFFLNNILLTVF